jgi:hypothetical protein
MTSHLSERDRILIMAIKVYMLWPVCSLLWLHLLLLSLSCHGTLVSLLFPYLNRQYSDLRTLASYSFCLEYSSLVFVCPISLPLSLFDIWLVYWILNSISGCSLYLFPFFFFSIVLNHYIVYISYNYLCTTQILPPPVTRPYRFITSRKIENWIILFNFIFPVPRTMPGTLQVLSIWWVVRWMSGWKE